MALRTADQTPRKPPQFLNQIMSFVLRSPLHGRVSKTLMLLTFTGRKSGKSYTIPVGYTRQGNTITLFTDHNWWKNFREKAPVRVRVRGQDLAGIAEVIEDKEVTAQELLRFIEQLPGAARAYGVTFDAEKRPEPESVRQAAQRFTLMHIQLNQG
jgi:deazaflavin-dependent oxidoreductase (nitroreductase family)